jgi:hypothetical protein
MYRLLIQKYACSQRRPFRSQCFPHGCLLHLKFSSDVLIALKVSLWSTHHAHGTTSANAKDVKGKYGDNVCRLAIDVDERHALKNLHDPSDLHRVRSKKGN